MAAKDARLRRSLPYCIWQHFLCEILNAVIIQRVIEQNGDNRFQAEVPPSDVLNLSTVIIPMPFLEYINGITTSILQCSDKVYFNLPNAGVPQQQVIANNAVVLDSGTFGACFLGPDNHNAYECYVSPYITRRLIERTLAMNTANGADRNFGQWDPLPGFPNGAVATPNLLGYELPEHLTFESINTLQDIVFANEDSMAGRLCHSNELITGVNTVLERYRGDFEFKVGTPTASVNNAAVIYTSVGARQQPNTRLSNTHGSMHSFEAFGSASSNIANYFAFKRLRNVHAYVHCYNVANAAPANWNATSNQNFNMEQPFEAFYGQDYAALRSNRCGLKVSTYIILCSIEISVYKFLKLFIVSIYTYI